MLIPFTFIAVLVLYRFYRHCRAENLRNQLWYYGQQPEQRSGIYLRDLKEAAIVANLMKARTK